MIHHGNNENVKCNWSSLQGGKHFALWEDPFKKPCYLFALVAGQLESRDDTFTTCSGRKVALKIWAPSQDLPKTEHAMYSLKAAMKWDEEIFNSKLVLASPETATDADYAAILGVIGHEYFHNWTGNRVTCRDWFQLSLKEGLTVFRDQEFSSDLGSRTVKRIGDVSKLRIYQFPQDASPMAHPVRPHSYIKMDNFYTVTVYEKGAEVVRMYKTLLGSEGFRKGTDLYFQRHDGQAVTCDDFFAAMRDANDADFVNFILWYSQAGTPSVKVTSSYNAEAHTFSLKFSQTVASQPPGTSLVKEPMFLFRGYGLLDIQVGEEEFVFNDVPEKPVPSLLRGYSAPIRLHSDLTESDLFFLLAHDSDEFNRWEAGQILARNLMLTQVVNFQKGNALVLNPQFVHGIKCIILDSCLDKEFVAKAITLPGEGEIMDMMEIADPDAVHAVRSFIRKQLASELKQEFLNLVKENRSSEKYEFNHENMARRALKNTALAYLASLEDEEITDLVLNEYKSATNMTDQFSALAAIAQKPGKARDDALADFYNQWQDDYLVVNKWFALQSSSDIPGNVENVRKLLSHQAFDLKDPNKASSLIGRFRASLVNFHAKDGSGYKFLGELAVQLDKLNPQMAAGIVSAFSRWKRYDETRQNLAKAQLEMIVSANGLSKNVYEIASKSLAHRMKPLMSIYFVSRALLTRLILTLCKVGGVLGVTLPYLSSRALHDVELRYPPIEKQEAKKLPIQVKRIPKPRYDTWTFTDGAASEKGIVLKSPDDREHTYGLRLGFDASNNEAEYEAVLARLKLVRTMESNIRPPEQRSMRGRTTTQVNSRGAKGILTRGGSYLDDTLMNFSDEASCLTTGRAKAQKKGNYHFRDGVLYRHTFMGLHSGQMCRPSLGKCNLRREPWWSMRHAFLLHGSGSGRKCNMYGLLLANNTRRRRGHCTNGESTSVAH
ncbi:puromycin-sensitive aminopeptidase isoform X2 [Tanacetum coccineum]